MDRPHIICWLNTFTNASTSCMPVPTLLKMGMFLELLPLMSCLNAIHNFQLGTAGPRIFDLVHGLLEHFCSVYCMHAFIIADLAVWYPISWDGWCPPPKAGPSTLVIVTGLIYRREWNHRMQGCLGHEDPDCGGPLFLLLLMVHGNSRMAIIEVPDAFGVYST